MESREQKSPQEKYADLDAIRKKFEGAADVVGTEIDPEIKDTVVARNALEICTVQSCEGHIEASGSAAPWVEIAAPDQPEYRFNRQKEIFESHAKKNNMSLPEFESGYPHRDEYFAALEEAESSGESAVYQTWRQKTQKTKNKMSQLLEQFYQGREAPEDIKIKIKEHEEGAFRIYNGGEDYTEEPRTAQEKKQQPGLAERQKAYRTEMNDFAKFLERKFLQSS
ncbi:MAG: hypothetical protein Q8P33_02030 [bacterium]|nr:hypothetical protein [bacterium]